MQCDQKDKQNQPKETKQVAKDKSFPNTVQ